MTSVTGMGKVMAWSAFGQFGKTGIMLIANIILARLLSPSEFGTMGILLVFLAFSDVFIDGGLASALIQKNNPSQEEYSGVFYFNAIISILCYTLLFFLAPSISLFFNDMTLTDMLRVIGIVLILNAIGIIQTTQLNIKLSFKKLSLYQVTSSLIGTIIAIALAFYGFGIWSLIYRNVSQSVILNGLLWYKSTWRPSSKFTFTHITGLFKFGGFMFLSTICEYIYSYIQPILIGKFFSMSELGCYTQARKLVEIPTNSLAGIVTSVAFPVLSRQKDNMEMFIKKSSSSLTKLSFITFPIMMWIVACSQDIILILFGEKWINAIPLLQILAIAGLFRIPSALNMCILMSLGKSKVFLGIQLLKRALGITCIIIGLAWGIYGLMWGFVAGSVFFFLIDGTTVGKYIHYGFYQQIKAILPYMILSGVAFFLTYMVSKSYIIHNQWVSLGTSTITYICSYVLICVVFKVKEFKYFYNQILGRIHK